MSCAPRSLRWRSRRHAAIAVAAIVAIARAWLPWPVVPVASLVIGMNFACLTFVAHEALHGGITRTRSLQRMAGWIGFLPFVVSPMAASKLTSLFNSLTKTKPADRYEHPYARALVASGAALVLV